MIAFDAIEFDKKQGVILLPEVDAVPFRSQSASGIGVQVTQERSPGFTLTMTRFTSPGLLQTELSTIRGKIGTEISISEYINGSAVNYSAPGGYKFKVTQARVVGWNVLPAFYGYRAGVYGSFAPALRIVSQWTMYAVENPIIP